MLKIKDTFAWRYYISSTLLENDRRNTGKWMYFFKYSDRFEVEKLVKTAVVSGVLSDSKLSYNHQNPNMPGRGVACFYADGSDIKTHQQILKYMISHNMIRRKKDGHLTNISFKYDSQTLDNKYGENFHAHLSLNDIL